MFYFDKNLKIATESGANVNISDAQSSIAHIYKHVGNYSKAIEMEESALAFYNDLNEGRS